MFQFFHTSFGSLGLRVWDEAFSKPFFYSGPFGDLGLFVSGILGQVWGIGPLGFGPSGSDSNRHFGVGYISPTICS